MNYSDMSNDELAKTAAVLGAKAKIANDEFEAAKAVLRARLLDVKSHTFGTVVVKISTNSRFDPATAKKNLTPAKYKQILVPTPSSKMALALVEAGKLTEDDLKNCKKFYDNKVTIEITE